MQEDETGDGRGGDVRRVPVRQVARGDLRAGAVCGAHPGQRLGHACWSGQEGTVGPARAVRHPELHTARLQHLGEVPQACLERWFGALDGTPGEFRRRPLGDYFPGRRRRGRRRAGAAFVHRPLHCRDREVCRGWAGRSCARVQDLSQSGVSMSMTLSKPNFMSGVNWSRHQCYAHESSGRHHGWVDIARLPGWSARVTSCPWRDGAGRPRRWPAARAWWGARSDHVSVRTD